MGRRFRPFAVCGRGVMAEDQTPNTELEPSTIEHGGLVFTVHYLRNTSHPQAPPWFAFTRVVFDQDGRVYPAEYFDIPPGQQAPAVEGRGATHVEAYRDLRARLFEVAPGEVPPC